MKATKRTLMSVVLGLVFSLCGFAMAGAAYAGEAVWSSRADDEIVNGSFEDTSYVYDATLGNGKWYLTSGENGATAESSTAHVKDGANALAVKGAAYNLGISYRLSDVPMYNLGNVNLGRTLRISSEMFADSADKTGEQGIYLAMEVYFTGAMEGDFTEAYKLDSVEGANYWAEFDAWTHREVTFSVVREGEDLLIQNGGNPIRLEKAIGLAAVEIRFYAFHNGAPIRFHLDDCHAVITEPDVTENARNLALGGGFENAETVFGTTPTAGTWYANGATLVSSAEAALGGNRSLKVSARANTDAGPVFRMDDETTYNMAVYTKSTYSAKFSFFATEQFYSQLVVGFTGYGGANYLGPIYFDGTDNNWGAEKVWNTRTIVFSVEKTAAGMKVSVGQESKFLEGATTIAAVDFHLRGWNASKQAVDFYLDNAEIIRTPVLFGDPNGGEAGAVVSYEVPAGENVKDYLDELSAPVRAHYEFVGWSLSNTETVAVDAVMELDNVTVYAIWEKASYTVTFDKNHEDATGDTALITGDAGSTVTLTQNGFVREGYRFAGWATAADGEVAYSDGENYELNSNATLYAVWEKATCTVTFDKNHEDATGDTMSITGDVGTTVTLTQNGFAREGYKFMGWATAADGNALFADGDTFLLSEDTTLYAVWEEIKEENPEPTPTPGGDDNEEQPEKPEKGGCAGCNGGSTAAVLLGLAAIVGCGAAKRFF